MTRPPDERPVGPTAMASPPAAPARAAQPRGPQPGPAPRVTARPSRSDRKAAPRSVAPRAVERRFRQTVTKVDLWSVTKLALAFYVSAMAVVVVAMIALWAIADAAGVIGSVESFIGDLVQSNDFHFLSGEVLRGAVLVSLVLVALLIVLTIVAASFYNIFAELFGGLEITIKEEEPPAEY